MRGAARGAGRGGAGPGPEGWAGGSGRCGGRDPEGPLGRGGASEREAGPGAAGCVGRVCGRGDQAGSLRYAGPVGAWYEG